LAAARAALKAADFRPFFKFLFACFMPAKIFLCNLPTTVGVLYERVTVLTL
jgi:hypothetical protein